MESNVISCKLKVPKDNGEKTPAFLVDFSNGCVNFNSPGELKFKCYKNVADEEITAFSTRRILSASNGRLHFKTSTYDDNRFCRNRFLYFIGVRNKDSSKMKMYNTASFHMKPVRNSNLALTSKEKDVKDRLNDLTATFGSKGKKRSMTARQKYSTNTSLLDDAFEDMAINDSPNPVSYTSPGSKTPTNIEYIPPQNHEAKFIQDVYKISDIIPVEMNEFLEERSQELLQDAPTHLSHWKTDGVYFEYVLKHLETDVDPEKAKYLLYYNYLAKFSCLLYPDMKKKDPAPDIPEPVKSMILKCFTITSVTENERITRAFPQKMKDKLLAYMIVLASFIDDYCINLSQLQNGTKYSMSKVSSVAQAVGCYVKQRKVENSSVPFAELRLPLNILQKFRKKF